MAKTRPPFAALRDVAPSARAAFVDRDGVINEDRGYVGRMEDFVLIPGAIEGLRLLQSAGYKLVVITNQSGIARGLYSQQDYQQLMRQVRQRLSEQGVRLDGAYHCPHHPEHGIGALRTDCECRKPRPGMLLRARDELDLDLARSVLIGDQATDIEAGRNAGVGTCVLVRSASAADHRSFSAPVDLIATDLLEAASWVVSSGKS